MKLIICCDKNGGISFAGRRQSSDSAVRKKIYEIIGDQKLYLNSYSAGWFESTERLFISESFISDMKSGDFCFAENTEPDLALFDEIYVFCWNRDYPADRYLSLESPFKKIKSTSFVGNSHKKITLSVYGREEK